MSWELTPKIPSRVPDGEILTPDQQQILVGENEDKVLIYEQGFDRWTLRQKGSDSWNLKSKGSASWNLKSKVTE